MLYSAGILLVRTEKGRPEFLLLHTGGPYWVGKDRHAWSFPKGEIDEGEDALTAAKREWREESGLSLPSEPYIALPKVGNRRKIVQTFMAKGDADISHFCSNTYTEEWPKGSGVQQEFPEADDIGWFALKEAKEKIHKYLIPVLDHAVDFM